MKKLIPFMKSVSINFSLFIYALDVFFYCLTYSLTYLVIGCNCKTKPIVIPHKMADVLYYGALTNVKLVKIEVEIASKYSIRLCFIRNVHHSAITCKYLFTCFLHLFQMVRSECTVTINQIH